MTPQEQAQLKELIDFKRNLESSNTIPLTVDQAFRGRFVIPPEVTTSTKGATTENQPVNEGGSASYSVLKAPDAFLQVIISGSTYYIPIFT